jgi:hypothetical protein
MGWLPLGLKVTENTGQGNAMKSTTQGWLPLGLKVTENIELKALCL